MPVEKNRMSVRQARAVSDAAKYSPKQWERKVGGFLKMAETRHGNRPDPTELQRKKGITPPAPDAGWWRDKDRGTPAENKKRMPGHLDWLYWRTYRPAGRRPFPLFLMDQLPLWKQNIVHRIPGPFTFDLYFECKTGKGEPNQEQLRTIHRVNLNPGAHAFVVYPGDEEWIRKVLDV